MQIKIIPLTKAKGLPAEGELVSQTHDYLNLRVVQRGRGRSVPIEKIVHIPNAAVAWEEVGTTAGEAEVSAAPAPRRGRPPKVETVDVVPKRRGRPPKDKTAETPPKRQYTKRTKPEPEGDVGDEAPAPKRRGRPPKEQVAGEAPKRRGRPPKVETADATPKRRGRPPKAKPVVEDDDGDETPQRGRSAAAEWQGDFKPAAVEAKPQRRRAAKPEDDEQHPKVKATRRPFTVDDDDASEF